MKKSKKLSKKSEIPKINKQELDDQDLTVNLTSRAKRKSLILLLFIKSKNLQN